MTPWSNYFQLKEPERTSLELYTAQDARHFVDLDGVLDAIQKKAPLQKPFKLVVEADHGTGKTHLLRNLEQVTQVPQHQPVYVMLSGFDRKAQFIQVWRQLLSGLFPVLEQGCRTQVREKPKLLKSLDPDFQHALSILWPAPKQRILFPEDPPKSAEQLLAKRWLKADIDLRQTESTKGGYTRRLLNATPVQLVGDLRALARLYHACTGKTLLLLMDESESFTRITDEVSQANIAAGLRELFDPSNTELGVVVGLNTPGSRAGVHPMLRSEVRSRMTGLYTRLKPLESDERIEKFLRQLWTKLARDPEANPFRLSNDALKMFASAANIKRWRAMMDPSQRETQPVVARDVCSLLNVVGTIAVQQQPPMIKTEHLRDWFGEA